MATNGLPMGPEPDTLTPLQIVENLIVAQDTDGIKKYLGSILAQGQTLQEQLRRYESGAEDTHIASSQLPRPPKPEIFWGDDKRPPFVRSWLFEMEVFFSNYPELTDMARINYVQLFLRGVAQNWWHLCTRMMDSGTLERISTWETFKRAITAQFGGFDEVEKAIESLTRLRQVSTVSLYIHQWNETLLMIPPEHVVDPMMTSWFVAGLKPFIQVHVRIAKPSTLREAMSLADRIERVRYWPASYMGKSGGNYRHRPPVHATGPEPMVLGNITAPRTPPRSRQEAAPNLAYPRPAIQVPRKTSAKPIKPLSDSQRDYLRATNGCFYCRRPNAGHISTNCPLKKGSAPKKKAPNRRA